MVTIDCDRMTDFFHEKKSRDKNPRALRNLHRVLVATNAF